MIEPLTLSQARLLAFLTCRQRFQLRYLDQLAWPDLPLAPQQHTAIEQGQKFHQLLERYFLGLPDDELATSDRQLRTWWKRFADNVLPLPKGRILPELRLTVPVGRHFLTGRFDLVVIANEDERPNVHIYDWKTSRPSPVNELQEAWQSKLYLAMIAESKTALIGGSQAPDPDQIRLTYWYVTDPQTPRTIVYSQERHEQNCTEIQSLVSELDSCLQTNQWPLTEDWSHCRSCAYWAYCGRFEAGTAPNILAEELSNIEVDPLPILDPESP